MPKRVLVIIVKQCEVTSYYLPVARREPFHANVPIRAECAKEEYVTCFVSESTNNKRPLVVLTLSWRPSRHQHNEATLSVLSDWFSTDSKSVTSREYTLRRYLQGEKRIETTIMRRIENSEQLCRKILLFRKIVYNCFGSVKNAVEFHFSFFFHFNSGFRGLHTLLCPIRQQVYYAWTMREH